MNYFGTIKRVKVEQGVTPRDFDRSKLFTQVPPVIIDEEKVGTYKLTINTMYHNTNIKNIITKLLGVQILAYTEINYKLEVSMKLVANETQVKLIRLLKGFKHIEEIK